MRLGYYVITSSQKQVKSMSMMEHHVLIDEKIGDLNGDGIPDRVSLYGDKLPYSDLIENIIIEVEGVPSEEYKIDMITEVSGINPTLFLGDFTKDQADEILFCMDKMFINFEANAKGEFAVDMETLKDGYLDIIFASDRYHLEYPFFVEYKDLYKISIQNTTVNKIFFLDISDKGHDYLTQFYHENGELIKPIQGKVLKAEAFIPVVSDLKENAYDLLAVHRIVGVTGSDILGYMENLLSWDGERFVSIRMVASTLGAVLIGL